MLSSISTYLVFLKTVLEDVLYDQTTCLTQCDFMPHAAQSLVDITHDLGWGVAPTEFKELLPDMACVSVNDSLWNAAK